MRIAVFASWYPSSSDPIAGVFIEDQAIALARRHQVFVIACANPRYWDEGEKGPPLAPIRFEERRRVAVVRTSFVTPPLRFVGPAAGWHLYDLNARRAFKAAGRAFGRPDIIHAHVAFPGGWVALKLGRSLGIPVVLSEHMSPFAAHFNVSAFWSRRVAYAIRGANKVLAVGEGLRTEIRDSLGVDAVVAPNAVASEFFDVLLRSDRGSSEHPIRLLAVGFLVEQKRFDLLIDALAQIAPRGPRMELVIIGDGPRRASLEAQTARLGLSARIRFLPMGSRSYLIKWLSWCDALVSSSDHESFGMVIAEALAVGRPVVATRSGGPEEYVGQDIGLLVPPGDAGALARALATLPDFFRAFSPDVARARMSERFGPDAIAERLTAIYADVLDHQPSASGAGVNGRVTSSGGNWRW